MIRYRQQQERSGVVLLSVLVVVVLLSLAAYKYSDYMLSEYHATDSAIHSVQARAFADSGVHYTAALLADSTNATLNGNPFDNTTAFQDILVPSSVEKARPGRFTILSLRRPEDIQGGMTPYRFGALDEASKINLNAALQLDRGKGDILYKMLMALPNMTDDVANAIIDWIDPDETPRQNGAESDYYSTLTPAYQCKNGPLDSLEELLLVRGVTPQLLFGNDRNRNGVLDRGEDDGTGTVDMGWSAYLTVYSREANVDSTGAARVYLNDPDVNTLFTTLNTVLSSADLATYIVACRMYGSTPMPTGAAAMTLMRSSGAAGGASNQIASDRGNAAQNRKLQNISSLWDLVNSYVTVTVGSGRQQTKQILPSPLNDPGMQGQLLPLLLDKCTTSKQTDMSARININTAPLVVLQALQAAAGLQETDIQAIQSKQPDPSAGPPDTSYNTLAWLITQAALPVATVKKLDQFATARTQVYRFQSIGYFERGGAMIRVEAVVDTNQGRPRILYWRNLSELGRAFNLKDIRGQ